MVSVVVMVIMRMASINSRGEQTNENKNQGNASHRSFHRSENNRQTLPSQTGLTQLSLRFKIQASSAMAIMPWEVCKQNDRVANFAELLNSPRCSDDQKKA
jgi:hypothetical protein